MARPIDPSAVGIGRQKGKSRALRAAAGPSTVKGSSAPTPPAAPPAAPPQAIPLPPSNLDALIRRTTWPATTVIHRIHPEKYKSEEFNPGPDGNARFSPIRDENGASIPTIYGGTTFECAAMETVFHDVPHAPGLKSVAKRKLRHHQYSQLTSSTELVLADLSSKALRKVGVTRAELLETDKDVYPQTRAYAEAVHAQCKDVQGLHWTSRQDDSAQAIMLFGDRLPADPLQRVAASKDVVADAATFSALIDLAGVIGVKITGK